MNNNEKFFSEIKRLLGLDQKKLLAIRREARFIKFILNLKKLISKETEEIEKQLFQVENIISGTNRILNDHFDDYKVFSRPFLRKKSFLFLFLFLIIVLLLAICHQLYNITN